MVVGLDIFGFWHNPLRQGKERFENGIRGEWGQGYKKTRTTVNCNC